MKIPQIGCMIWDGNYNVKGDVNYRYGKRLKYFEYNWITPEDEKIVVFSDLAIPVAKIHRFADVPCKVAWMIESPMIYAFWGQFKPIKEWLLSNLDMFTAVATCDDSLVEKYPDKMVYVPAGGVIIPKEEMQIYSKTKLCVMTSGHLWYPRNLIYGKYKDSNIIDFLGKSFNNPYTKHVDGFRDYMYHITVSSCNVEKYFSANLMDPLACGCVPIWKGCSKLGDFFDMDGIITFNTLEELDNILKKIGQEDYSNRLEAIKTNFQLAVEKYRTAENPLWENLLSKLI